VVAHKGQVNGPLFDDRLRRLRLERAAHIGGDRFLIDRAFTECLDRLGDVRTSFASALIVGQASDAHQAALARIAPQIQVVRQMDDWTVIAPASFDLCVAIGDLETANDLTAAAFALRNALRPGGLLIGAIAGGGSLPQLRRAMLAADRSVGSAAPRFHPGIDGPSLAALLTSAGLLMPVVDVHRVDVAYASLDRLVMDLRAMGYTNVLKTRSTKALTRRQLQVAREGFLDGKRQTIERFELLHFAAWAPRV
jgi:NADH dehydrogenase [ubiquinone] 1 alpha subcomplex assembly factor 5